MKTKFLLSIFIVALCVTVSTAQTRRRTAAPSAKTTTAKELRTGAERIAAEAKILSTFLYRYGAVVEGIRIAEKNATENGAPPEALALFQKQKVGVAATVRNLVGGMQDLERYLALSPSTKPYLDVVNGLSQDVDLAADTAAAGKLDEAAVQLLTVLDNLTGALLPPAPPK